MFTLPQITPDPFEIALNTYTESLLPLVFFFLLFTVSAYILLRTISGSWKKRSIRRRKARDIKQQVYSEALSVLEDAQEDALDLLTSSKGKVREMVNKSDFVGKHVAKFVEQEIRKITEAHLESLRQLSSESLVAYKHAVEEEKGRGVSAVAEASGALRQALLEQIEEFKELFEKETMLFDEGVRQKIRGEFEKVRGDLESYKKARMDEVDNNLYGLLTELSVEILGKSFSAEEHEELILGAVERARKEGAFNV